MKPFPISEVATIVIHSSALYMRSNGENGELDCDPVGIVKGKERTNDAGSGESYMSYWRESEGIYQRSNNVGGVECLGLLMPDTRL